MTGGARLTGLTLALLIRKRRAVARACGCGGAEQGRAQAGEARWRARRAQGARLWARLWRRGGLGTGGLRRRRRLEQGLGYGGIGTADGFKRIPQRDK